MYSFVKPIVELMAKTYPRVLLLPPRDKLSVTFLGRICQRVAAAAAKSLQSFPTLCDPIDGSPPGSAVPADMFIPSWMAWSHNRASFLADAAAVVSATT